MLADTMRGMESPHLASVRAKIDRAQIHLDAIKAALRLVLGTKPEVHHVATELDFKRQEIISTIPKVEPLEPTLPLMIGDCIHNLRSALDHLVYQLAVQHGTSSDFADKTFFPICLTDTEFNDRPRKRIKPLVSDSAFTEIEKSQPYFAYDIPEESDIWVLHKLDIIDKHRLLIVARDQFAITEFTMILGNQPPLHQVISKPKWKPMEDGAEIIRFQTPMLLEAPPKVGVKIQLARTVEFINTGFACDGIPISSVLNQAMALVRAITRDFGKQFFGE